MTFLLQVLINSLVIGTQFLLLGASFYLINSISKVINVGLASSVVIGAYSYYFFNLHFGMWAGLAAALVNTLIFGALNYLLLRKFIVNGKTWLGFLVGVALYLMVQAILGILFGSDGKFLDTGVLPVFNFGGLVINSVGILLLLYGLLIMIFAFIFFYFLPMGRIVRAISQHRELTTLLGVNSENIRLICFIVGSVCAGFMGILMAYDSSLTPRMGEISLISSFVALLVGGITDFKGFVVSAYILTLIPEFVVSSNFGKFSISNLEKSLEKFFLFSLRKFYLEGLLYQ